MGGVEFGSRMDEQASGESPQARVSISLFKRIALITGTLLASLALSGTLVIYNKWLFQVCDENSPSNCRGWGFPFPLLVTCCHMWFIYLVLSVAVHVLKIVEEPKISPETYWNRVVPYATLVALDIALSNVSFVYLEATFVEMCKSSMPAIVLALSIFMGLESFTPFLAGLIGLMCLGLAISSVGEANFSTPGFIIVMIAVLMGSSKLVLVQALLQGSPEAQEHKHADEELDNLEADERDSGELERLGTRERRESPRESPRRAKTKEEAFQGLSSIQILFLQAPISGIILIIPSAVSLFYRLDRVNLSTDPHFVTSTILIVLIGGCIALFLDMSHLFVVQFTSALSLTVAGVARTSAIILASWLFFRNEVTRMTLYGYVICLIGVVMYNVYKYQKLKREIAIEEFSRDPDAPDEVVNGT